MKQQGVVTVCGHERVLRWEIGNRDVVVCVVCDHGWEEHPGELVFAHGVVTGTALLLLAPRDERGIPDPLFEETDHGS